jgi:hypothetical protein
MRAPAPSGTIVALLAVLTAACGWTPEPTKLSADGGVGLALDASLDDAALASPDAGVEPDLDASVEPAVDAAGAPDAAAPQDVAAVLGDAGALDDAGIPLDAGPLGPDGGAGPLECPDADFVPCGGDVAGLWHLVDFCGPAGPASALQDCEGPGEDVAECQDPPNARQCRTVYGGSMEFGPDGQGLARFGVGLEVRYTLDEPCLLPDRGSTPTPAPRARGHLGRGRVWGARQRSPGLRLVGWRVHLRGGASP